jgi:hypothetical protein
MCVLCYSPLLISFLIWISEQLLESLIQHQDFRHSSFSCWAAGAGCLPFYSVATCGLVPRFPAERGRRWARIFSFLALASVVPARAWVIFSSLSVTRSLRSWSLLISSVPPVRVACAQLASNSSSDVFLLVADFRGLVLSQVNFFGLSLCECAAPASFSSFVSSPWTARF